MTTENKLQPQWCAYCRKATHNDDKCWSTRPLNWRPEPPSPIPPTSAFDYGVFRKAFEDWKRDAAKGMRAS